MNYAHPGLKRIILEFFYLDPEALSVNFPDDFKKEVPIQVIALVATTVSRFIGCIEFAELKYAQMHNIFDGYAVNGAYTCVPFYAAAYAGLYRSILKNIDKLRADGKRQAAFDARRRDWAAEGM